MAQTKTKRRPVAKTPATRTRPTAQARPASAIDRTTKLSEEVLDSV